MPLTLEDIAHISGFSRSTVSRVINGDSKVSEKTRERIMEIVHKYDFQPNLAARGLAAGRTGIIGLVIPMTVSAIFSEPFFQILTQGVSSGCNAHDYSVMLWLAEPEYERRTVTKILYNGLIDGIIVASMVTNDPIVDSLSNNKLPFILIGRHNSYDHLSYVDVDNHAGAKQAVLHIIHTGRQRIATITGPQNMIAGLDRYQGYLDALHEHGIAVDPDLIVQSDFSDTGAYTSMQNLLKYKPDAVFAASDAMAIGAMQAVLDAGLRVPQDISFVGFEDSPQASRSKPSLTTVRQSGYQMGATAVEMLIDIIENSIKMPQQIILPTELVIRDSCGSRV